MTFSRFYYLHFPSHETPPLHHFLQLKHFKNGIFCTEEGSVPVSERYIPPSEIEGGISVQKPTDSLAIPLPQLAQYRFFILKFLFILHKVDNKRTKKNIFL
nr:MAG TPA: hypothetical protein [Caudoviricetes sp.]